MKPFIVIDNLSFDYQVRGSNTIPALSHLTLKIEEGEYIAIIGANGSGKSTLARHLDALLLPDKGNVLVANIDTRDKTLHRRIRTEVGIVFQSPEDQIVATTVQEDVAFGPEKLGLPAEEIQKRVEHSLQRVELWEERLRPPHLLSSGQMQRVALAGALAMRPKCIIFDETSSMLDPRGRQTMMDEMSSLHSEGLTIIHITHSMDEAAHAERVIALHEGKIILDGSPQFVFNQTQTLEQIGLNIPPAAKVGMMLRPLIPAMNTNILTIDNLLQGIPVYPIANHTRQQLLENFPTSRNNNGVLIDVNDLSYTYMPRTPFAHSALCGVSLHVIDHTIHALLGATGSGKSTLLQHLNGLLTPQAGSVRVGPYQLDIPDVDLKGVRKLAGFVFQNPEMQLFEQYVGDEIAFGPRISGLQTDLRSRVRWAMEMVGLGFDEYKDRISFSLSGGERHKVALASILAIQPQILLLDEPLAGFDPASRSDLLLKFKELRSAGMTLLLSTHNMEDVAMLADDITVMYAGKDRITGTPSEVFANSTIIRGLGLELPVIARTAEEFRKRGWDLPPGIIDPQVLCDWIGRLAAS